MQIQARPALFCGSGESPPERFSERPTQPEQLSQRVPDLTIDVVRLPNFSEGPDAFLAAERDLDVWIDNGEKKFRVLPRDRFQELLPKRMKARIVFTFITWGKPVRPVGLWRFGNLA